jgi:hypothetical protein
MRINAKGLHESYDLPMIDIFNELEKLRLSHYECDDCWYYCPESGQCRRKLTDKKCGCVANSHNKTLDEIIEYLKSPKENLT